MVTSRTGTARWKRTRREAIRLATHQGITNCPLCSTPMDYQQGGMPNSAEVDHIHPHALGGTDDIENTRVICRHCNQSRGAKTRPTGTVKATTTNLIEW